jgi:hypothetical protein
MTTPYFSVELSTLQHLGSRLEEVASTVKAGATFPHAEGAEAYSELSGAVGDFKDDWDNGVARLEEKVRGWGQKAKALSSLMAEHDSSMAGAWSGKGQ